MSLSAKLENKSQHGIVFQLVTRKLRLLKVFLLKMLTAEYWSQDGLECTNPVLSQELGPVSRQNGICSLQM